MSQVPATVVHGATASAETRRSIAHHAFSSGSDVDSTSSCAMTDTMPSTPGLPLGEIGVLAVHAPRQRLLSPTNEYRMVLAPYAP